jgi:pilus assembly protein FimV
MADLAHEFDLPKLPESTPPVSYAADPLADLDAMHFDLPATQGAGNVAPADDPFALPDLPSSASGYAAAPQFDMSDIDLDLPSGEPEGGRVEEFAMETKLDLAIAYQEIGDKEGARELLDEVIKGGSHEQIGKANDMRSKLA